MTYLKKYKKIIVPCLLIFAILLVANFLTPMLNDDYNYLYSFSTGERIDSIADIYHSMVAHRVMFNGRVFVHAIVQFVLMFPKWVFNIVNSVMFLVQIFLILYIAGYKTKDKKYPFVFLLTFALIWIFQPAFGTVNLWLSGSVNYLWCSVVLLLFLIPYIRLLKQEEYRYNYFVQIIFVLFGFIAGTFSENASPAAMGMALLIMIICKIRKQKIKLFMVLSVVASIFGTVYLLTAPAQIGRESTSIFSFDNLFSDLFIMTASTADITIFAVLLLYGVIFFISKKRYNMVWLPSVFFAGGVASVVALIFADYYPERRMFFLLITILIADLYILKETEIPIKYRKLKNFAGILISTFLIVSLITGFKGIYKTFSEAKSNEKYIIECKEKGILEIDLPYITSDSKYSPIYEINYCQYSNERPNTEMAKYFSVDTISCDYT